MKTQKFFFGEVNGLKAEIQRHREYEIDLRNKLAEYEEAGNDNLARTYLHFLTHLLQSKAEVVSQIGRTPNVKWSS